MKAVEDVIKKEFGVKAGYFTKETDEKTGRDTLLVFANREDYDRWKEDPESVAPVSMAQLPLGADTQSSSEVRIVTNSPEIIESSNKNVSVNIIVTSIIKSGITGETEDFGEDAIVSVERMGADGEYVKVSHAIIQTTRKRDVYPSSAYTKISLGDSLVNGENSYRLMAEGRLSGVKSKPANFTVAYANMSLKFGTRWEEAFVLDENDVATKKVNIGFKMAGSVNKELNYEFYNAEGVKLDYGKIEVGTAEYDQSNFNLQLNHTGLVGIYRVKAWLNYANSSIETEPVEQNVMLSVKGDEEVLVVVNNVESPVVNWSSQHVMDYAVWNPTAQGGECDVALVLKDTEGEKTWMTTNVAGVKNGVRYDYSPYLSIENYDSEGQKVKLFATRLHMMVDGEEKRVLTFSVDNTNDFAPTVGANFVLIPSMRSNNDTDRTVIRNESALETEPKTIAAEWNGVLWENDGWVSVNGVKMLRMLAGTSVRIPYECYSNKTKTDGLTMEVDLAVRNIADEEAEVLTIGKMTDGGFVGLKVTGRRAVMYKAEGNVDYFQDIEWQEGERTHVAVNIMPRLTVNGRDLRVVRMFINGKINREFTYTANDNFWDGVASNGIVIGGEGADVDVYGMRVFKDKMVASSEVLNDYVASLSDVDKKLAIIEANNIMEGGVISYRKAKGKYNVLVWKGRYPSKLQQADTVGDLMIDIVDDPAHSGVINAMSCKGQGSSSKKYLLWNGTFAFGEDSVWVDGNGNEQGAYYQLTNRSPRMTKTVGKLNWASSMQSHKMGLTAMYQDLYNDIFDGTAGYEPNGITTIPGYENTRIAVEEKAFLFFVQEDESKDPVYYGNMTWGSAKGDKMTFGYDKNHERLKNYLMLEGSDQTPKLTLYQVPWFADEVTYNETEEYYQYNGFGSWDVTLGNRESVDKFIEKHNFVYSYSTRLRYWNGNLTSLQKADEETADRSYQYFIVGQSYGNFDVYRYDWLKNEWVNAGTTKDENGNPVAVNLNTQLGLSVSETDADFEAVLATFKAARVAKFREGIGRYVHVNDFLFTMQFLKFVGASDNRAKNTYEYYDPVGGLIRQAQDDLDTVLPNNNQGQKQKPYWVEEHDFDSRQMFNGYFWAGSGNAMYNTFEDAYGRELRQMMAKIMASMARLGGGNVMGCWERYFFAIQDYFPAVAYNECARLWYEYAKTLYDAGEYTNDTDPITQSLGDLKECEKEWVKNRILYMASYCEYASALGESIEFRQTNSSVYRLTPAMKMYVYMGLGTSSVYPVGYKASKRTEKGEEVVFNIVGSGDSIQTEIRAVGLLESVGDLSRVGVTGSTNFSAGKRLVELKLGDANASVVKFNPSAVNSFPENAVSIDMTNCGSQLTQIGSIANLNKLEVLKAKGTGVTVWVLPQNNKLKTVELPDGARTLEIRNQMNLETLDVDASALQRLTMGKVNVDVQAFVEEWLEGVEDASVCEVSLDGVDFAEFSADNMMKLIGMSRCVIKGRIAFDGDSVSAEQLGAIRSKLGNLLDNGELVLVYANTISLSISPLNFVGGYGSAHFKAGGLTDAEISLVYDDLEGALKMRNVTSVVEGGCRIYEGDFYTEEEVPATRMIEVRATDGSIVSSSAYLSVQMVIKAQSVNINVGTKYIAEVSSSIEYGARIMPDNYAAELTTIEWGIVGVGDTSRYTIGKEGNLSWVERMSDGMKMVTLYNGGRATQAIAVNELMTAKNNDTSFTLQCRVTDTTGTDVSATYDVVAHERFTPKAVQSYDPTEENYNPALIIYLKNNEATTGVTLHEQTFQDGSRGFYMTQEEAAAVTNLGTINGLTQTQDTNGYVIESYEGGILNPNSFYDFDNFDNLVYFKGTNNVNISSCSRLKYITFHNNFRFNYLLSLGTLKRVKIEYGHTGNLTNGETFNLKLNSDCELHIPVTYDDSSDGILRYSRPKAVYFGGTIQQWLAKHLLPSFPYSRQFSEIDNEAGNYPFDLYCNNELIETIDASILNNETAYKIYRCKSLKTITGALNNLGSYSFVQCSNLENINLGQTITSIPEYCFYGCARLQFSTIPSNITSIGTHAFSNSGASFNEIPDSVTSFGPQSNIKSTRMSYPNTMSAPGGLGDCTLLQTVEFRKDAGDEYIITTIPSFYNCVNLRKIISHVNEDGCFSIPNSVKSLVVGSSDMNVPRADALYIKGDTLLCDGLTSLSWVEGQNTGNPTPIFIRASNLKSYLARTDADSKNGGVSLYSELIESFSQFNWGIASDFFMLWINNNVPPLMVATGGQYQNSKVFVPIGSIINYIDTTWFTSNKKKVIEYDYSKDRVNVKTATSKNYLQINKVPLYTPVIVVSNNTATITCTDSTFTSVVPIKLHYRINGGAWSSPVNSGTTFAVSDGDYIEVYATHIMKGPSNMLKATYSGGNITYDYNNVYIDPDNLPE